MVSFDADAFKDTVRKQHTELWDFPTVTFYNYTGGYDPQDGETDWTRDSGTNVTAEFMETPPSADSTPAGLELEGGDAAVRISDEETVDLVPMGTDDEKPTEMEDFNGRYYVVKDVLTPRNGLLFVVLEEGDR